MPPQRTKKLIANGNNESDGITEVQDATDKVLLSKLVMGEERAPRSTHIAAQKIWHRIMTGTASEACSAKRDLGRPKNVVESAFVKHARAKAPTMARTPVKVNAANAINLDLVWMATCNSP